jgi:NAD(P)H-hydrate epimerase
MKVVTAEVMQQLDRRTIEEAGIPGVVLMENAGRGTVGVLLKNYPHVLKGTVAVIAGKGNNGGDGFVIARYLINRGVRVRIFLLGARGKIRGDAKINLDSVLKMQVPLTEIKNSAGWKVHRGELEGCTLIVDAIFGTGLTADIGGLIGEVIHHLNGLTIPTVAVDLPSGLHPDTGAVLGCCVQADCTVTFGLPKRGLFLYPGAQYAGSIKIVDISIPSAFVDEALLPDHVLSFADMSQALKVRNPDTHKGDYGHVLAIAGSRGKTGAAVLTCQAAARVGAGLVTLGIPESLHAIVEQKLTEVMTEPLSEHTAGFLGLSSFEKIRELMEGKKVLVLGPGLSTGEDTVKLVHAVIKESSIPVVVDADGLNALGAHPGVLQQVDVPVVVTPHPGEMARLVGVSVREVQGDRIAIAKDFARRYGCYLVLKGARSLIAEPDGSLAINLTGNPGMASGGMGDLLTGMIPGFIAQGYDCATSIKLSVFIHGLAGDLLRRERGPVGFIAGDVLSEVPRVLQALADQTLPPAVSSDHRYQLESIL